ncbi:MAG: MBL fold metallo-hydrolase, partial [Candidatus Bathyarchaeia archaeon]
VFDPSASSPHENIFITHAHADHSAAFRSPDKLKYSTEETHTLVDSSRRKVAGKWSRIAPGDRVKIGDLEVRAHNAGHIRGSVQYEVVTPGGSLLYTGDFSYVDTYTMRAAEVVPCDLLVVETTFGAPLFSFPPREKIAVDLVRWAVNEVIQRGRIPAFQTDSIGNAQEIITIFNRMTRLPVVTTSTVTRANRVYERYGYKLDYVDADSEEGVELLSSGDCVLIAPKGSKLSKYGNLETAFASGWAILLRRGERQPFPLSDHADFRQLLSFIRRCAPKRVFTFHGGRFSQDCADHARRRLGIEAGPLTEGEETLRGRLSPETARVGACFRKILEMVRIPGFEYTKRWLVREMAKKGFSRAEVDRALRRLIDQGLILQTQDSEKIKLC